MSPKLVNHFHAVLYKIKALTRDFTETNEINVPYFQKLGQNDAMYRLVNLGYITLSLNKKKTYYTISILEVDGIKDFYKDVHKEYERYFVKDNKFQTDAYYFQFDGQKVTYKNIEWAPRPSGTACQLIKKLYKHKSHNSLSIKSLSKELGVTKKQLERAVYYIQDTLHLTKKKIKPIYIEDGYIHLDVTK